MTAPKNSEAQNEELDLEQLKDAVGGLEGGSGNDTYLRGPKRTVQNIGGTAGPGGTSYPSQKSQSVLIMTFALIAGDALLR